MKNIYGEEKGMKANMEAIKDEPKKKRREYFWEYYGRRIVSLSLLGICLVGIIVFLCLNAREKFLVGTIYDFEVADEDIEVLVNVVKKDFPTSERTKKYDIIYTLLDDEGTETRIYQYQALAARIAAKDIDFIIGKKELVSAFIGETKDVTYYANLAEFLPADLYNELKKAGRIVTAETPYGDTELFVNIAHSPITDYLKIEKDDVYLGLCLTAPHPESLYGLLSLLKE